MSTTNPLLTSLIPGSNNSGTSISVPYGSSGGSTASGQNPMMPQVPSGSNSTFSAYSSPYASTSGAVPATTIPGGLQAAGTPGAPASSPGSSLTSGQQTSLNTSLSKDYGSGIGGLIEQFLAGGAGFNQTAVNQLLAAMAPQNEQNQQNLLTSFGSSGNRFSSGAQIGDAAMLSQESLNAGELESQMYEQSVTNYINTLMGVADTTANRAENQPSTWDTITSSLGLASDAASGLSAAGVGGSSGTLSSLLSGLAAA